MFLKNKTEQEVNFSTSSSTRTGRRWTSTDQFPSGSASSSSFPTSAWVGSITPAPTSAWVGLSPPAPTSAWVGLSPSAPTSAWVGLSPPAHT